MIEKAKRQKKGTISEEDISAILQRYTATTVLSLLKEVAQFPGVKLNWDALVKKTSTGISNAREYQMLWRHLAYNDALLEKLEDGAEPLDDDSDLESELEPCPSVSSEASAEAAACVKVLIASGLPSDSSIASSSMVEAPLTINIPNAQSFGVSSENLQPTCSTRGMNITVPVSVRKQKLSEGTSAETLERNGSAGANLPARRKRKPWSEPEDAELFAAVQKYGAGNWANISREHFKGDRTASQLGQRWANIGKKPGKSNAEGNSTIPQLSEAQLATRCALSLALDMPDKNLTAACANNPGKKTTSNNQTLATTSGEASVQAQSQFQQGLISSVPAQNHSQQGPLTSISVHNQPQKGPTTSVAAHNPPQKGPITSVPIRNQSQQGLVASVQMPNQPQQCPMTTKTSPRGSLGSNQSQQGPVASVQVPNEPQQCSMTTKTSPRGSSGSTLKSWVTFNKPLAKSLSSTDLNLDAIAVAAGARICSPETATPLCKDVQSKNAIHLMTSAEPLSCPAVTSSTLHTGSVPSTTQRVEQVPSASTSSLNVSNQQCNAVMSSPTIEGHLKEELEAAVEIKGSVSDCLPKNHLQENGACVSKNEEGVKDHQAAVPNPESELNLVAVTEHSNEKLMVENDKVEITANLVEEGKTANENMIDCSLAKSQAIAEGSCRNQNTIDTPVEASLNGCNKNLDALSTAETGQTA